MSEKSVDFMLYMNIPEMSRDVKRKSYCPTDIYTKNVWEEGAWWSQK